MKRGIEDVSVILAPSKAYSLLSERRDLFTKGFTMACDHVHCFLCFTQIEVDLEHENCDCSSWIKVQTYCLENKRIL